MFKDKDYTSQYMHRVQIPSRFSENCSYRNPHFSSTRIFVDQYWKKNCPFSYQAHRKVSSSIHTCVSRMVGVWPLQSRDRESCLPSLKAAAGPAERGAAALHSRPRDYPLFRRTVAPAEGEGNRWLLCSGCGCGRGCSLQVDDGVVGSTDGCGGWWGE